MKLLSGYNPCAFYDADVHPATLLTASTIAAGCALVLFVCVVVALVVFWRDERPAWKRVTPIMGATGALAAAFTALSARLTYAGYPQPSLAPGAPADDWCAHIGQAAMDWLGQQIQLFSTMALVLVLLTLVLVFAWGVLLQVHAVSQRRP